MSGKSPLVNIIWLKCALLVCATVLLVAGVQAGILPQENTEQNTEHPLQEIVDTTLWITENYPPFHYVHERRIRGKAIKILSVIFKRNGIVFNPQKQVLVYPWARAYKEVSNNPNAAVLTMALTEERSNLFRLSVPLFNEHIALMSRRDGTKQLQEISDIANLIIGVVRDDIGERLLKDLDLPQLHLVHVQTSRELFKLLVNNRVDMISYSEEILSWQLSKQKTLATTELRTQRILAELPATIAFNRDANEQLVTFMNDNIRKLQEDGTIKDIMSGE